MNDLGVRREREEEEGRAGNEIRGANKAAVAPEPPKPPNSKCPGL
jgi:hypothetical protein